MNCGDLPGTGGPAGWLLLAALGCLTVGLLLWRRRERGSDPVILIMIMMLGAGFTVAAPTPGYAAANDCADSGDTTDQALVITQTSVVDDLGPGNPPADIRGRVTNPSLDSTYVSTVTVGIASVTKAFGAARGTCSSADYVITNPRMPVDRPLAALSHVSFSGATISFLSTPDNQDACKRATISFTYLSDSR